MSEEENTAEATTFDAKISKLGDEIAELFAALKVFSSSW